MKTPSQCSRVITVVFGILFLFALYPFLLLISFKTADVFHREMIYMSIVDRFAPANETPLQQSEHLFHFDQTQAFDIKNYPTVYATPLTPLIRGVGWCDQQAGLLTTLLRRRNIPGRVLALFMKEGQPSNHSVAEALIQGRWILLDP